MSSCTYALKSLISEFVSQLVNPLVVLRAELTLGTPNLCTESSAFQFRVPKQLSQSSIKHDKDDHDITANKKRSLIITYLFIEHKSIKRSIADFFTEERTLENE